MSLLIGGLMALGGTDYGRSVNRELGRSSTAQISMNDATVRSLTATSSSTALALTNFYGKSYNPSDQYLPISVSGDNSVVDNNIPALIGSAD